MVFFALCRYNIVTHCRNFKNECTYIYFAKSRWQIKHYNCSWFYFTKATTHPKDIIPRRGLITGAKIQIFLHKCKKMAKSFSPFSVWRRADGAITWGAERHTLLVYFGYDPSLIIACHFLAKNSLVFFVQFALYFGYRGNKCYFCHIIISLIVLCDYYVITMWLLCDSECFIISSCH